MIRFGGIGIINTVIDIGLLFVLKSLGLPVVSANIISSSIAFVFSFFANKKYAFRSKSGDVVREIILFLTVTLFGLWIIQNLIIYLLLPVIEIIFGQQNIALLISKLIATGASMVWNYAMYRLVVFRKN